jgi:hypothetical protein
MDRDINSACKILKFQHTNQTLLKKIAKEAAKELCYLYQITAGFQDPTPPTEEEILAFLEGHMEL